MKIQAGLFVVCSFIFSLTSAIELYANIDCKKPSDGETTCSLRIPQASILATIKVPEALAFDKTDITEGHADFDIEPKDILQAGGTFDVVFDNDSKNLVISIKKYGTDDTLFKYIGPSIGSVEYNGVKGSASVKEVQFTMSPP
ncbi:hypothetical protein DFQ30_002153 [Apophysomyces sp. BC1015]|nr:hypothetical protein DFQ30_002153 [Apophysomyces sp. BC1015]